MSVVDFGRDTWCLDELKTGRWVTGPMLVAQAFYRRLRTPRGVLRGGEAEENYGLNLPGLIGASNPKTLAATLPGKILAEGKKDERIDSVEVTLVSTTVGPATTFDITIVGQTALGPFTLVVRASAVTVALLGVTAEGG